MKPFAIYFGITQLCNMRCPMCITRGHKAGAPKMELTRREIRNTILKPCKDLGMVSIAISGGEPLIVRHTAATLSDAVKLGYSVYLATNLLKFDTGMMKKIFRILDDEKHCIQVSFDSIETAQMNAIRGKDVFFDVVNHCMELVSLREKLNVKTPLVGSAILQPNNVDSIIKTIDYVINELKFDKILVQQRHDYPVINIDNYKEQAAISTNRYDTAMNEKLVSASLEIAELTKKDPRVELAKGEVKDWVALYNNPTDIKKRCEADNMIFIDSYWNIRGCLFGEVLGNVKPGGIAEFLESKKYTDFLKLCAVCNICTHGCS